MSCQSLDAVALFELQVIVWVYGLYFKHVLFFVFIRAVEALNFLIMLTHALIFSSHINAVWMHTVHSYGDLCHCFCQRMKYTTDM